MPTEAIPKEVREQVQAIVDQFNREAFADGERSYIPRFKGNYLYLDRRDYGSVGPICRLEYTGDMQNWQFAMYQFCSAQYGSGGSSFPGAHFLDGTVQGAMKAGAQGYD